MKKTKTKNKAKSVKTVSKSRPSNKAGVGQRVGMWLPIVVAAILLVGFQIVRANSNDGLALTTPVGSLRRESQLDSLELQYEAQTEETSSQQLSDNLNGDPTGLTAMTKVTGDASE